MKAYVDYRFSTEKKYVMIAIKALVCQYIDRECVYVSREFEQIVPRSAKKLDVGIYLCQFNSDSEYIDTVKNLMKTASGFIIPTYDYDALYSEYEGMFHIPSDKDLPMYLEAKTYFNDGDPFSGMNNTITIMVHNWNLTFQEVAYDVPANKKDRKEPEYYAREMLNNLKSDRFNVARAFTNAVDKMRYDASHITNSIDSLKDYCTGVCNYMHEEGYNMCVFYITYSDGCHDRCYARSASDLYNGINRRKRNMVLRVYIQVKICRPLVIGETYIVEFSNGKKFSYLHKNMAEFEKIFNKYVLRNKSFILR